MIKKCVICNQEFECTENGQCWCMQYKYSETLLKELRNKYADCLCPSCLSKYMQQHDKDLKKQ